ncbi:hypothetical protein NMY22_g15907 [Coprinellus aureogranulatus]|nr:hypothetical protein NMY22_g15907 [Coprinellus aureogranulatus]
MPPATPDFEEQFREANAAFFFSRELCGLDNVKVEGKTKWAMRSSFIWLYFIYVFNVVNLKFSISSRVARMGKQKDDLFIEYRPKPVSMGSVNYPDDAMLLEGSEDEHTQYHALYYIRMDPATSTLSSRLVKTRNSQERLDPRIFRFGIEGDSIDDAYLTIQSPWTAMKGCLFMVSTPESSKTLLAGGSVLNDPDEPLDYRGPMRYSRISIPARVVDAIKKNPTKVRIVLIIKLNRNSILLNHLLSSVVKNAAPLTHLRLYLSFNKEHSDFNIVSYLSPVKIPGKRGFHDDSSSPASRRRDKCLPQDPEFTTSVKSP